MGQSLLFLLCFNKLNIGLFSIILVEAGVASSLETSHHRRGGVLLRQSAISLFPVIVKAH